MEIEPENLLPYFGVYRIVSIPPMCTKLRLKMGYDDHDLSEKVNRFTISWTTTRLHQKWLAESMYMDSIEIK